LERISQARPEAESAEAARASAQRAVPTPLDLNDWAWLSATSPRKDLRDGRIAVILAEKAVAATSREDPAILDTLAAGLAEAGRFAEAAGVQREAVGLLNDAKSKDDYGTRLDLYESNAPYRNAATNGLAPTADDRLALAALLQTRGTLCAQFVQLTLAAGDLTKAIALDPDEHSSWYHLAPLLLETGDTGGYRKHCHAMLTRFGTTNAPPIAERTAEVCLLLPLDGADLAAATRLAETAVTLGKGNPSEPYSQFLKGLAEYRQANFAQAVGWIQQALIQPGTVYSRDIQSCSVLAMALQRLNQAGEAREALSKATELAGAKLPRLDGGDLGPSWHNWIIAHILLREAKALIEGGPKAGDETK
jgi:tetratricopeptide (TPR) repeat protein